MRTNGSYTFFPILTNLDYKLKKSNKFDKTKIKKRRASQPSHLKKNQVLTKFFFPIILHRLWILTSKILIHEKKK